MRRRSPQTSHAQLIVLTQHWQDVSTYFYHPESNDLPKTVPLLFRQIVAIVHLGHGSSKAVDDCLPSNHSAAKQTYYSVSVQLRLLD